jgi:hypothetical protein
LAKLRRGLEDSRVKEADPATFSTEIQLSPALLNQAIVIKWLKDGIELLSSDEKDKFKIEQDIDGKSVLKAKLTINNCAVDTDSGEYLCQLFVNNELLDVKQTPAKLQIKEAEPRLLKELPATLTLTEGETLVLTVQISKPGLAVEWLKDSQTVKLTTSGVSIKNHEQNYTLEILNVQGKQSGGKYKLAYKNSILTECRVVVKPAALTVSQPLIESVVVREGENASFACEFNRTVAENNANNVKLEWYKNGKRLYFSNKSLKYQLVIESARCELVVRDCVQGEDDAGYELRVCDQSDDTCLLTLRTQLIVRPPGIKVTDGLANTAVVEGDVAKLHFRVSKPLTSGGSCQWFVMKKFASEPVNPATFDAPLLNDANFFAPVDPGLISFNSNNNSYNMVLPDAQIEQVCFN